MSQTVLARHINVDQSSIAYWESGRTAPKHSRLVALADVLSVTPEWLQFGVAKSGGGGEVPVIAVIGGTGIGTADSDAPEATIDFELPEKDAENVAVTISGHALAPIYQDGDVLIGPQMTPETALREFQTDCVFGMRDGRTLLVRAPAGRALPSGPIADASKISWIMPVTWIRKNTAQAATQSTFDGSEAKLQTTITEPPTRLKPVAALG